MRITQALLQPSTYSIGLAYEMLVLNVLQKYSFQIRHTGGTGDGGQDFSGYWMLPDKKIPVVGQCKCFRKAIGPVDVREFEDVLFRKFVATDLDHTPSPQSISGYIGLMASQSWFTSAALKTFHSSRLPMILCQVLPERTGRQLQTEHSHSTPGHSGPEPTSTDPRLDSDVSTQSCCDDKQLNDSGQHCEEGKTTDPVCDEPRVSTFSQVHSKSNKQIPNIDRLETSSSKSKFHYSTQGYVNEIALNSKAQRLIGNVQVVWKQSTRKFDGLLKVFNHRQLHMVISGVTLLER